MGRELVRVVKTERIRVVLAGSPRRGAGGNGDSADTSSLQAACASWLLRERCRGSGKASWLTAGAWTLPFKLLHLRAGPGVCGGQERVLFGGWS